GRTPEESIAVPSAAFLVRNLPIASKFSSAKPIGSMRAWQLAHTGLARCCSMRPRIERTLLCLSSFSDGTLSGGGGGGAPRRFSSNHLPRRVGEVRVGYEVTVRMLACPNNPRRAGSVTTTRRKSLP